MTTQERLSQAMRWIRDHGIHADDCETVTRQDEPQFALVSMDALEAICTCGLTALLKSAEADAEQNKAETRISEQASEQHHFGLQHGGGTTFSQLKIKEE